MYKLSHYNLFVPYGEKVIYFNTLKGSSFTLSMAEHERIQEKLTDPISFELAYPSVFKQFKSFGLIVDEETEELDEFRFRHHEKMFNDRNYHLTLVCGWENDLDLYLPPQSVVKDVPATKFPCQIKRHIRHMVENKPTGLINLQGAIDKMATSIDIWEQTYLFRSPIDGIVSFSNYWSKNQFVSQGEKVFAVVAESPGEIIGKCVLPVNGAGKVEAGQSVNIKLDGYPYMEYGMLQGKVKNVSLVPTGITTSEGSQRFIVAEISLDRNLVTTYRKELPFNGEMSGISEILTNEMSLLEHFVNPLRHLWSKMK